MGPNTGQNGQINYVVVIVMENRTVDNLFAGYFRETYGGCGSWHNCGVDIVDPLNLPSPNAGYTLAPYPLESPADGNHHHNGGFATECDAVHSSTTFVCLNDGWPNEGFGGSCPTGINCAFSMVPTSETTPYAQMIKNWGFADAVYQGNEGPSFPAHLYLIAGQSGALPDNHVFPPDYTIAENPIHNEPVGYYPYPDPNHSDVPFCGGGDNTQTLDMNLDYYDAEQGEQGNPTMPPCFGSNFTTIFDQLAPAITPPLYPYLWEYHGGHPNDLWEAPMAVRRFCCSSTPVPNFVVDPDAYNFVTQEVQPTPATGPNLAAVTYLIPCQSESDHPGGKYQDGPEWVGWVVNNIGSNYDLWKQTAIFIVWDDWGGWYDHDAPISASPNPYEILNPSPDPYEWGYRVPLIVISPYTPNKLTHTKYSSSAILNFIEWNFGTSSLSADDTSGNNGQFYRDTNLFDFSMSPRPFATFNIGTPAWTPPAQVVNNGKCP